MFSIVLLVFVAFSNAEQRPQIVRRLLSYPTECKIMPANSAASGDLPANPSSTAMVFIFKEDDSHLQKMDFATSGNNDVDMDDAKDWCRNRFGDDSVPIGAVSANNYDALVNIATKYKNNTFMGLVRDMADRTSTISYCDKWVDTASTVVYSSAAWFDNPDKWYSSASREEPVCKDNFDTEHIRYDSGNKKQCVVYNFADGKLVAYRCDHKAIIACSWHDDKCDVSF